MASATQINIYKLYKCRLGFHPQNTEILLNFTQDDFFLGGPQEHPSLDSLDMRNSPPGSGRDRLGSHRFMGIRPCAKVFCSLYER